MRGRSADATLSLHALSPCRVRGAGLREASCRSDWQSPLHSTTIFVYNACGSVHRCALGQSMTHRRVLHEGFSEGTPPVLVSRGQETAAPARSGGQRPTPGRLARCRSDTTAALDTAFLQKRPRGDDGMAQGPRVYFLGTLTRHPEVRYAPNGMAVARCSVAVPTRLRQGDTWHVDVCFIEVVAFGPHAETMGAAQRQGRGVLIEGRLQRRWEQEGPSRCTRSHYRTPPGAVPPPRQRPGGRRGGKLPVGRTTGGGLPGAETAPWQPWGPAAVPWYPAYGMGRRAQHQRT